MQETMQQHSGSELAFHTDLLEKVAHDLRGPAGVTLGALEELDLSIGKSGDHAALIEMAQRGVKKILRTAERLTRLSRLAAGQELALAPIDLVRVVREACTEVTFLEGRRSVTLSPELPDDPMRALADETWLRALVGELLSQALRSARSSVGVALRKVDGKLVLSVRDDGAPGDRPLALAKSDGDSVPLRSDPVFALRLAADIARMHDAALELSPEAAPGVTVQLSLPAA
jgi:signal transduction histidine kinase